MPLRTKGFRSKHHLTVHFQKHRHECGAAHDEKDYEQRADFFLSGPQSLSHHDHHRMTGDFVRYDATTGEFGCLSHDGYIKTYKVFGDLAKGLLYFQRQKVRYP